MKVGDHRIRPGGLMRCCIGTLLEASDDACQPDGFVTCRYCGDRMQLQQAATDSGYAWAWAPTDQ